MLNARLAAVCAAAAIAVTAVVPAPLAAQSARPMLEYASAAAMRDGCVAYAKENSISVAIAVYDDELRLVSFDMMDGTSNISGELAHWKAKGAANYRVASADTAKWNVPHVPGIATFGGGVPVFTAEGAPLGAIGVSGSTQDGDIACAMAGIAAAGLTDSKD